ncbi:MAG TPA: DUF2085 domain-containing protein [Bacteroidota bacterium]|nr:DUF2085 domain-containing protein [Bacteroidota bacterium]
MRSERLTHAVILAGAALWCMLILAAPLATATSAMPFGALVYAFFQPVCHQIDARSFHLFGAPLAVCARCSSIYFGFLAGTIVYPAFRARIRRRTPGRLFLAVAVAPMAVEVIAEMAGLSEFSNAVRAFTGAWFGLLITAVILHGAEEGAAELFVRRPVHSVQPEKGLADA